jgi:Subtilase family/Peptidase inhibitor I9
MKKALVFLVAIALCALALPSLFVAHSQNNAQAPLANQSTNKFRKSSHPIAGQYVVAFKADMERSQIASTARDLAVAHGGRIMFIYEDAIKGFAVELPEQAAIALSHNPQVDSVSENGYSVIMGSESTPQGPTTFWGLDRIDQRDLPLNDTYNYNRVGTGVHAYVLDTGIWVTHQDFGTRALTVDTVGGGYDSFGGDGIDRNNHGTFVAGIIGGKTYGVAKNVELHSVKVCNDSGVCPDSNVIAGLNWVISNHINPAVVNMSLGQFTSQSGTYQNVDNAVRNTVASGVTCVVAAGNNNVNASTVYPAHVAEAITVGATTRYDAKASYSNYGFVIDVFAPGGQAPDHYIPVPASGYFYGGANNVADGATGTSMAAPHVTGVVALYLEQYSLTPSDPAASPTNVSSAITGNATPDRISGLETCRYNPYLDDIICTPNSNNLLLYSLFMSPPASNPIDSTRIFVRQQYFDFLRRTPDALWEQWISYIDGCGSDAQCLNSRRITTTRGVIESQEFRQNHPILLNNSPSTQAYREEYVRQLYLCLLQREPDGGYYAWLNYLNSTNDYDGLVGGFINSTEYHARFQ